MRILAVSSPEWPPFGYVSVKLAELRELGWWAATLEHGTTKPGRDLAQAWGKAGGRTRPIEDPVSVLREQTAADCLDLLVLFIGKHAPLPRAVMKVAVEVGWPPMVTYTESPDGER